MIPGLWSIPVPIPGNPLRFVYCYAFETDRGPVLVDPGWSTEESHAALESALVACALEVTATYGVVVTHHHRDHSGLAGRVQAESGAYVVAHANDAAIILDTAWLAGGLLEGELAADGVPSAEEESIRAAAAAWSHEIEPVRRVSKVEDGELLDVPGWDVRVIWTPGHTPGHICLAVSREGRRFLLSGDHVLPRITPNVALTSRTNENPLHDYLGSLQRLRHEGPFDEVLPAHEWRFTDLLPRLNEIERHHAERLAEIRTLLRRRAHSTWELASSLSWHRDWEVLAPLARRSALNETRAHLAYLASEGATTVVGGGPTRYSLRKS